MVVIWPFEDFWSFLKLLMAKFGLFIFWILQPWGLSQVKRPIK
jgi:hypothetical protein